jgi:hypothetical protein
MPCDLLDISRELPRASGHQRPCGGGERGRDVWVRAPQARTREMAVPREGEGSSQFLVGPQFSLSLPFHITPPLSRGHRGFACALLFFRAIPSNENTTALQRPLSHVGCQFRNVTSQSV